MTAPRTVGCYGFVDRPYDAVRALLLRDPLSLLHRATTSASTRAQAIAVSLQLGAGGVELSVDVKLHVRRVVEETREGGSPCLRIELAWEPVRHGGLLPAMSASLVAWPFSAHETQLDLEGTYDVPMGPLGKLFEATIGHRIAQATMLRFLDDVQEQLLGELPAAS